jgi:hypothetical protein
LLLFEENQVAIQNYLSEKNISFFKDSLAECQNKLMRVDRAIAIWVDFQYHWTHIRPIFIDSENIIFSKMMEELY